MRFRKNVLPAKVPKMMLPPEPVTRTQQWVCGLIVTGIGAGCGYLAAPADMVGAALGGMGGSLAWLAVTTWRAHQVDPWYGTAPRKDGEGSIWRKE